MVHWRGDHACIPSVMTFRAIECRYAAWRQGASGRARYEQKEKADATTEQRNALGPSTTSPGCVRLNIALLVLFAICNELQTSLMSHQVASARGLLRSVPSRLPVCSPKEEGTLRAQCDGALDPQEHPPP